MYSRACLSGRVSSGCQKSIISTNLSSSEGLYVSWVNEVSKMIALFGCHSRLSPPTAIQQFFGISRPRWHVRMKFLPSEWGFTPTSQKNQVNNGMKSKAFCLSILPEFASCFANMTPRTANGISRLLSMAVVFGKSAVFGALHTPNRCNLIVLRSLFFHE